MQAYMCPDVPCVTLTYVTRMLLITKSNLKASYIKRRVGILLSKLMAYGSRKLIRKCKYEHEIERAWKLESEFWRKKKKQRTRRKPLRSKNKTLIQIHQFLHHYAETRIRLVEDEGIRHCTVSLPRHILPLASPEFLMFASIIRE